MVKEAGQAGDDDYRILRLKLRGRRIDDGRIVSQALRRVRNVLAKNGVRLQNGNTRKRTAKMRGTVVSGGYKPTMQRCAVRLSFSSNKVSGQWAAHGKYIARESARAAGDHGDREQGFTADGKILIADSLGRWQNAGDPRMFKLILSPEFGQDMESMEQFTKDFMMRLEKDLGVPLEWVAVDHYNTDHPHVHVALRGVDREGQELLIRPDYIKTTLRLRGQEAATQQLGVRTARQQDAAFEREVKQRRLTSLDRALQKRALETPDGNRIINFNDKMPKNENAKKMRLYQIRRLVVLEKMGLANPVGHMQWALVGDMEATLRKMQETGDILKTMYSVRDIASDPRMPINKVQRLESGQSIEGRLIATGEDETTSKQYLLLESLDGFVHYIYQTPAMQKARKEGSLKRGDYLSVEAKILDRQGKRVNAIVMRNHGSSHKLLTNEQLLTKQVLRTIQKHQALPESRPMIGWLGEYQQALKHRTAELLRAGIIRPGVGDGYVIATTPSRQAQGMQQKKRGLAR